MPPGDPERLLEARARLRTEPALVADLTALGPAYAVTHTSEAACLARAVAFIDTIAA